MKLKKKKKGESKRAYNVCRVVDVPCDSESWENMKVDECRTGGGGWLHPVLKTGRNIRVWRVRIRVRVGIPC